MNIAISTLVTPPQKRGIGNYVVFLLKALQDIDHHNRYFILTATDTRAIFDIHAPNFTPLMLPFQHEPRSLMRPAYFFWQNTLAYRLLKRYQIDVLHLPNLVPLLNPLVPTIVTVPDLAEYRVEKYPKLRQIYRRWIPHQIAKNAARVITISESSKRDFGSVTGYSLDKIDVTYLASAVENNPHVLDKDYCRNQYGIDGEYILHVGSTLPHKNIDRLILAFESVKKDMRRPLKLVLVGDKGRKERLLAQLSIRQDIVADIVLPGYVPDTDLPTLYRYASLFVFPSSYEGFGLPVLEAMSSGTPVITSNISSLPEVAGDAAILVDPTNVEMLASAITAVLRDDGLRESLVTKGHIQADKFSWSECARQTLVAYEKTLESSGKHPI